MSFVEVFATGKIERGLGMRLVESNDQKPFCESWSRDQGIASKLWKSKDQDARLQFDFWHIKNQAIKSFRREWSSDQAIKHNFFPIKILIPVANASTADM